MTGASRGRGSGGLLPLLALILGLGGGLGVGLLVSWELWPVEYVNVAPDSLYPAHRNEYLVLIGQTYAYDGDLAMAQARLVGLGDPAAVGAEIAALAERYVAQGDQPLYAEALAELAVALGHRRAPLVAYLAGETPIATWTPLPTATATPLPTATQTHTPLPTETPTATQTQTPMPTTTATATQTQTATAQAMATREATATPRPTRTPRPTHTPTVTPTPAPGFRVVEFGRTCEVAGGQLMIMVLDADGQQMPNIELLARWSGGDEHFFTGLKPEIGPGYADLALQKGETYQVVVVGAESEMAQVTKADTCESMGYLASWRVVFQWHSQIP